jgi:hypothetical protein
MDPFCSHHQRPGQPPAAASPRLPSHLPHSQRRVDRGCTKQCAGAEPARIPDRLCRGGRAGRGRVRGLGRGGPRRAQPPGAGQSGGNLTEAVLAAFRTSRLVGLGETHGLQEHHDLLQTLISDPRLPGVVDDIVVEFGNALYQDTIDKFVLECQPVNDADLRLVWRNTTQSPLETWDEPVYEQFYRRVRAVNWTLPPGRRIRVLLGDPPIDWPTVTSQQQHIVFLAQRNTHAASVVEQQVLAKGRRALLCYGAYHLLHANPVSGSGRASLVPLIEQQTGVRTYTIADLIPLHPDPGGLAAMLAGYPRGSAIRAAGTWLGQFNAGYVLPGDTNKNGQAVNCGTPLGDLLDAGLYLGQPADLTASWPDPAIFLGPAYWAELQRRNALGGNIVDLDAYRQQQPPAYPPQPAASC